jgi:adenosine deaminase
LVPHPWIQPCTYYFHSHYPRGLPDNISNHRVRFFPLFSSYIYKLCNDEESIRFSTLAVLNDFEDDGVVYLELRTTPREIAESGISKSRYVQIILDCIKEYEGDPANRLHIKLILSIDRRNTVEQAEEVVDLAISYQQDGVVAVDLCGDPTKGPVVPFKAAFARAKTSGLKVTLHFAEATASSTDEELYTLLSWQPDRIGHVIHVHDDLKQEIVKRGIGVELCLSCNVHAKMIVGGFADHHFGWWKDNHVGVALCVSGNTPPIDALDTRKN